jgi:hypothetical protein
MCERCRQRFLYVKNRLEELAWKYGPTLEPAPADVALMPTWGPDGSLAARCMTEEALKELFELHTEMLAMERSRHPERQSPSEPKGADW